jgi:hypothetical protein
MKPPILKCSSLLEEDGVEIRQAVLETYEAVGFIRSPQSALSKHYPRQLVSMTAPINPTEVIVARH